MKAPDFCKTDSFQSGYLHCAAIFCVNKDNSQKCASFAVFSSRKRKMNDDSCASCNVHTYKYPRDFLERDYLNRTKHHR